MLEQNEQNTDAIDYENKDNLPLFDHIERIFYLTDMDFLIYW